MSTPFSVTVTGNSTIPHPAERAVINVAVESSGTNKATVSDEVLTTAKHLESLLRQLAPADSSTEAKQASPLAHWSKTGLSATSHVPYHHPRDGSPAKPQPRQYNSSIQFDIRFKEFKALGGFGEKLSSLSHVEVRNIRWILTPATEKSYNSQLRREAAQDALDKAKDYCETLGCKDIRPIELTESGISPATTHGMAYGAQARMAQQAPGFGVRVGDGGHRDGGHRDESPLEFRPEEVEMSMDVTVRFHAM